MTKIALETSVHNVQMKNSDMILFSLYSGQISHGPKWAEEEWVWYLLWKCGMYLVSLKIHLQKSHIPSASFTGA